ncbi:enoyl-ACP reductase FabI [Denitrobaculum tricleocarpae]|uniref:Enoyl-[acyl-carrier-protein] reductase [NADH] n=1 Tax=Denitrobaculum tricleocarpae TaxID=2591009 RepID=A0A545U2C2_9PROT|nr:enoyl-ACP reductase FabI [Denitrobaculum tricleocarpae]TQV83629.1 enoyl-ACP reductase FabI [Denitrobaculum tricleocarpae]
MLPDTDFLAGKKGLVVGVANSHSIAAGCAQAFHAAGAQLALTYLNDKAQKFVQPVADSVGADILLPLDVTDDAQMDALFETIREDWGTLDFLLHSIAFCPREDLHGRVTDCSRAGFAQAMDISVHSLIRLARRAEPLMTNGGTLLTLSYHGAEKVVDHYNIMGPVKAALESTARYLSVELGPKNIRVNALSPGPLETRAASGIDHFDELIEDAKARAPLHRLTTIEEVGAMAACLVSDFARSVSGNTAYIDGGNHVV